MPCKNGQNYTKQMSKEKMKNYNYKKHLAISSIVSILIYLIIAFCSWDILAITKIGDLDWIARAFITLVFLGTHFYILIYMKDNK